MKILFKFSRLALACAALPFLFSSCTTLVSGAEVKKVKTVAIVGFEYFKQSQNLLLGAADTMASKESKTALADQLYTATANQLSAELGWKVMDQKTLSENEAYKKLFATAGEKSKFRLDIGKKLQPKGILTPEAFAEMPKADLDKLAGELGVDAVITLQAMAYIGESIGFGDLAFVKYRVTMEDFIIQNPAQAKPIVHLGNLIGNTPNDVDRTPSLFGINLNDSEDKGLLAASVQVVRDAVRTIKEKL